MKTPNLHDGNIALNRREVYMKGIGHSYCYEGCTAFQAERL